MHEGNASFESELFAEVHRDGKIVSPKQLVREKRTLLQKLAAIGKRP